MERNEYTRVTEVLKPFSGIEFVPEEFLKPASMRGSLVHQYIENHIAGFPTPIENDNISPYLDSFEWFWEESKHVFDDGNIILEKRLFCDDAKITGQADCIIETKNKTYIFDWKTSRVIHKPVFSLQGAAYKYLAQVNGYSNVDNVVFVKLDRNGKKPTIFKNENFDESLDKFFKCLELFHFFDMKNTRGD